MEHNKRKALVEKLKRKERKDNWQCDSQVKQDQRDGESDNWIMMNERDSDYLGLEVVARASIDLFLHCDSAYAQSILSDLWDYISLFQRANAISNYGISAC